MSPEDFTFFARLLRERTGMVLSSDKSYLVENRLLPVMREHKLADLDAVVAELRRGGAELTGAALDAMLPKDTGFFRDWKPFRHLGATVLPNLRRARAAKRSIRVLSLGCATGQETYSVAMLMVEDAEALAGWQVEIVGADLSAAAIAAAERGQYSQFDIQRGLPIRRLLRHFAKDEGGWRINDAPRRLAAFRRWNALDDLYPLGRFDVVLCRNLLIGFDQQTKLATLQKIARLLADDGALYVGADESVTGVSGSFRPVAPELGIYAAHREGVPASRSIAVSA
jgi:chemotaxis protein methyltransferase CheR